jgi:hypothetical protein
MPQIIAVIRSVLVTRSLALHPWHETLRTAAAEPRREEPGRAARLAL